MDEFIIKSSVDSCALIFFDRLPEDRSRSMDSFCVKIARGDLSAETNVWAAYQGADPSTWLEDISRHWKGWEGERIWESLEHELSLTAKHERFGHIHVRVRMQSGFTERDWRVDAFLLLYAGELESLAKQAPRFFGRDGCLQ